MKTSDSKNGPSRLTLGTVVQGMRYGAVNTAGDPSAELAMAVFDAAWHAGITCLDTARVYGEAEMRIGAWLAERGHKPFLISKLPAVDESAGADAVKEHFCRSASALGTERLFGYLCHHTPNFTLPQVRRGLEMLKADGRIAHFGVSLYSVEEFENALGVPGLGVVQLPLNLANMAMMRSGLIQRAADRGILIFARSVFLQGILLAEPERIPSALAGLREPVRKLHGLAAAAQTSAVAIALAAVDEVPGVHSIVIGTETPEQVEATAAAFSAPRPDANILRQAASFFVDIPASLTDPSRWPPL